MAERRHLVNGVGRMREPPMPLIVDDQQDIRDILEARLASQGYATALALDDADAIRQASTLGP